MENEIKESRWSKFVSSFEDYKYSSFGEIDEYYLTPQERTNMFKKATEDLKLKVKALREQKNQIKIKLNKMESAIKKAYIYHFEPKPPTQNQLSITKLIEYAKVTDFKKNN